MRIGRRARAAGCRSGRPRWTSATTRSPSGIRNAARPGRVRRIAGALLAALLYEYLYLRPGRPAVVGTPESGVDEPRPGDAATS